MRRLALIAVLVLAAGGALAAGAGGADDDGRYTVVLDNSFGLTEGADLKSSGVRVGKVEKLDVERRTARALVTIKIELPSFAGFRKDVFCEVEPQSLIGEYFLDCKPGTSREPAPRTIPVEQTGGTIPPDLVQNVLRRPARERLGLILAELGGGLAARGDDLQATIRRGVPALRETDKVLRILADNQRTLQALTRDADTVLARLSDNRADVARFVSEAGDTAAASARRRDELGATVRKLPTFLRELRPTLRELGTAAERQTPALADLRAAAPDLTTLFERLGPFAESARPATRALGEASDTGVPAARAARPTVRRLRTLGAKSTEPITNLRFMLETLDDREKAWEPNPESPGGKGFTGLEAPLQYLYTQSQAVNIFDSRGYILKLNVLLNECNNYTDAAHARENVERTKDCTQALGPTQPGIRTAVGQSAPRSRPDRPRDREETEPDAPAAAPTPAPPPAPEAPAPPATPAPPSRNPLDRLLDDLPRLPEILPPLLRPREQRASPSPQSDRNLLDFLLGP